MVNVQVDFLCRSASAFLRKGTSSTRKHLNFMYLKIIHICIFHLYFRLLQVHGNKRYRIIPIYTRNGAGKTKLHIRALGVAASPDSTNARQFHEREPEFCYCLVTLPFLSLSTVATRMSLPANHLIVTQIYQVNPYLPCRPRIPPTKSTEEFVHHRHVGPRDLSALSLLVYPSLSQSVYSSCQLLPSLLFLPPLFFFIFCPFSLFLLFLHPTYIPSSPSPFSRSNLLSFHNIHLPPIHPLYSALPIPSFHPHPPTTRSYPR